MSYTPIAQVIMALPIPGDPAADAQDAYDAKQSAFTVAQKNMGTELNTLKNQINVVAGETDVNGATASAAAIAAVAAAEAATNAANVNGTSATNTTPAIGAGKTWVYVEADRTVLAGQRLRVVSAANPLTNYALGTVTAWNAGTKTVTVTVDAIGTGPVAAADWNVILDGQPGQGATLQTATASFGATGNLIKANAGAAVKVTTTSVLTLAAPAALGDGWSVFIPKTEFVITLTASSGTIVANDGAAAAASKLVYIKGAAVLQCDGVGFTLTHILPGDHEVTVHTGNNYGSTNTHIRRYTTTTRNVGGAITYADSATLGASFTINEAGLFEIISADVDSSAASAGISLNGSSLATSITLIAPNEKVAYATNAPVSGVPNVTVTRTMRLAAADVIRPHTGGVNATNNNGVYFSIRKVGL